MNATDSPTIRYRRGEPIESGSAGIRIVLEDGDITIWHDEAGDKLAVLREAPKGTWDALWDAFRSLGFRRIR